MFSLIGLPGVVDAEIAEESPGCFCLSTPFARDDGHRVASVECRLDFTTHDARRPRRKTFYEFSFAIKIISLIDDCEPFETQDRAIVRHYLDEASCAAIMPIVVEGCSLLIGRIQPAAIYRVAKAATRLEKALRKHQRLTMLLEDHGYRLEEQGDDPFRRPYWVMAKSY